MKPAKRTKDSSPRSTGPASGQFEAKVGTHYALVLLASTEPFGLPVHAAIKAAKLTDLPVKYKKALWAQLKMHKTGALKPVEFAPMAILKVDELVSEPYEKALRYVNAQETHIVSNPEILGGTPVIAKTRITVYSVLARLEDGEGLNEIARDYPGVPREAFEAAAIYAKANPLMGRPKRPWHAAA